MRRRFPAACAVSIALLWAPASAGPVQTPSAGQETSVPTDIARALTRAAPFTPTELAALQSGQVITRGVFARPPAEADVARLALDAGDVTDLAACRPDVCAIRMGGATPSQIAEAVQSRSADTLEHANSWFRQTLVPYVTDYLNRGDLALAEHDDRGMRVDVPVEWQGIFARSPLLPLLAPSVEQYLNGTPGKPPAGATEEIYWDKQRYTGLKPVVAVTHMVTWQDPARPDRVVIAQKQIFASRYFFGSLAVTLVQQDPSAAKPTTYIVYANRLRGDLLRGTQPTRQAGLLGRVNAVAAGFQRRVGEELVKQSAEQLLSSMKQQLEK